MFHLLRLVTVQDLHGSGKELIKELHPIQGLRSLSQASYADRLPKTELHGKRFPSLFYGAFWLLTLCYWGSCALYVNGVLLQVLPGSCCEHAPSRS